MVNNRMGQKKVAVVTGGNRGIGFEICRQLATRDIDVILTSRDKSKGEDAAEELMKEGRSVTCRVLDVADPYSIKDFCAYLSKEVGRCDVLVNNAGIFPDTQNASPESFPSVFDSSVETIQLAMGTNVYGPLRLCQGIVPLMKAQGYGRIVNMSSGMGQLSAMNGGCPAYRLSKTALNALTCILADELQQDNILVNSMCPGWVKTNMGGPYATRTVEEGADTAVWLATLDNDGPRGKFFRDQKLFAW